jgi:hypothetical protein
MSQKRMPRLGSAIASTILSVFSAVSLVGVDKAQAAVLTYKIVDYDDRSYFKVDTSLLTGITYIPGYETIPVIEGRLYDFILGDTKEYYDLAAVTALFFEGDFLGVRAWGNDSVEKVSISAPDEPGGTFSFLEENYVNWEINITSSSGHWLNSRRHFNYESYINDGSLIQEYYEPLWSPYWRDREVSYTLVKTETVPEPLTAGGTALALAGLSWLKHKKKMAA